MTVIYGVVKQNVIQLPIGIELADGDRVEIRVRVPSPNPKKHQESETLFKEELLDVGLLSRIVKPEALFASERDFKQKLLEAGLLVTIKPAVSPMWTAHTPISISGKPLSEIIIEERR